MQKYVDGNNLIPKEQKGCRSGTKGCKDQLLLSKAILQECKCRKKILSMAWFDYQKAFDSVPHGWIIKSLELIGFNNRVISFVKKVMPHCTTRMCLHAEQKLIKTEYINVKYVIFQGDSLSPLLFYICLNPLTEQLNRLNTGYEEHTKKTKISHMLYMDDSKLIAKSEEELQRQILTVKTFSYDIHMEFGLGNVLKLHLSEANSFPHKI
jgi:hypothetical protein